MKTLFIVFLCYVNTCLLLSQQNDTIDIEEVVVTTSKVAVSRNNVPFTISIINKNEILESSESALLPVLSEQIPGVFVTERGITGFGVANGSAGSINIRGIGGNPNTQVLILLNGNPQFMGIMGHPLPDAYVSSDVEKVEVIRGPASTLYGSNAMGGVINIITKEQRKEGYTANVRMIYGSYNTQKYMVNGGVKKNGFHAFASFNHDQTDGHRDSSDFSINNGYVDLGYDISSHLNVTANFSLANFNATDPGAESTKMAGESIDIMRGMGAFSLNNQYNSTSGSLRFFYNFGEHNITDGFHSLDNNYGIIAYQSLDLFKGNTITLGADYKNYGGKAENTLAMNGSGVIFGDTTVSELAGYVFAQQILFNQLTLNAGFRLEHNSVYGLEPVPSGGIAWHANIRTTLKASVAKGFRSPTIRELYLWAPANSNLNPERMINYEAGIIQKLLNNKLSLELTGFKVKGDNLIHIVVEENGPKNQNSGSFSNTGIEFTSKYKPVDNLFLHLNYSYISMESPILSTPEQQIFASATYTFLRDFSVNVSIQNIKNLYLTTGDTPIKETYTLLNARLGYSVNKHFNVFLKADNLLNKEYQINYDYPMPRFTAFGGINLQL